MVSEITLYVDVHVPVLVHIFQYIVSFVLILIVDFFLLWQKPTHFHNVIFISYFHNSHKYTYCRPIVYTFI